MELTLVASSTLTITYGYDPLDRLTAADYSDGSFFHYAYDAAGNRLSETTPSESNLYTYDDANRLASANGVAYAWDANGNLLSDGVNSYTYDGANRLTGVTDGVSAVSYAYNGLGDRLQTSAGGQTTRYTLDLVSGLTQVLEDGDYTYLYGNGRVAQYGAHGGEYFLGDALSSVRQLADASGAVRLTRSYQPYGELLASNGDGASVYGFTGEATDALTGMVYLRARWYAPRKGRFFTKDSFMGFPDYPQSLHPYAYTENNPINFTDPSGLTPSSATNPTPFPYHVLYLIQATSGGCGLLEFINQLEDKAWHAYGQIMTGLSFEYARSIAWASPEAQRILGPSYLESDWMLAGRIVGDILAIGSGVILTTGGIGAFGTGALECGTGILCVAGGPAVVAGAGAVTLGGSITVGGLIGLGDNLSLFAGRRRSEGDRHRGYIEQLQSMKDSSLRKTIRSLERQIQIHMDKIASNPTSRDVPHWQRELNTFQEELDLAIQAAERRGIR